MSLILGILLVYIFPPNILALRMFWLTFGTELNGRLAVLFGHFQAPRLLIVLYVRPCVRLCPCRNVSLSALTKLSLIQFSASASQN